jgi:hypothetical protein
MKDSDSKVVNNMKIIDTALKSYAIHWGGRLISTWLTNIEDNDYAKNVLKSYWLFTMPYICSNQWYWYQSFGHSYLLITKLYNEDNANYFSTWDIESITKKLWNYFDLLANENIGKDIANAKYSTWMNSYYIIYH